MLRFSIIVIGLFLIIILPSMNYQTYALESEVIEGKLTEPCGILAFGGQEVGSFEMRTVERGSKTILEFLKIEMKEPPESENYDVGFAGSKGVNLLNKEMIPVDEYESNQRVMIVKNKFLSPFAETLFVADGSSETHKGAALLWPSIESFPEPTQFKYKNVTIAHILELEKDEYMIGERIQLKPQLINLGNENLNITHGDPPFIMTAYSLDGKPAWVDQYPMLTIGIGATLEPGIPYGWHTGPPQKRYDIRFCTPGEYTLVSYADFLAHEHKDGSSYQSVKIYAEPVTIKVGPSLVDRNVNFDCPHDNIEFEKKLYNDKISRINNSVNSFKVNHPDASIAEQNEYLLRQGGGHLNAAGYNAECLSNNGVDPDSVAVLSNQAQQLLMYDYDRLSEIAPKLVKYSTVPEFPVVWLVLIASFFVVSMYTRHLRRTKYVQI